MELNLNNNIINNAKENAFIKHLIEELKNYLDKNKMSNSILENKEENLLENGEEKMITTYRDKMNLERNEILNNYAKQTSNKGQMYYIYSKSSQKLDTYNMCICEEGKSHNVIEINKQDLPYGAEIGSVIRKKEEKYTLDYEATKKISDELSKLKNKILQEQEIYLSSQRKEGHVYEMSEKAEDRAWLFDITENKEEALEEIEFPKELLENAQDGDKFIYKEGKYQNY